MAPMQKSLMTSDHRGLRLSGLQIAFLVAAVIACRIAAIRACPTYDDAFITYRYAANLADGNGLVFNAGATWEPILGTTTLLYSLILSGFSALGLDLVRASLALNIVCDAVTALLLVRILGRRPVVATAAVLGFASLPELARISVGGMESPLFLVCAVSACFAVQNGRAGLAGILTAATCLVRPEGVLLAGILFLAQVRRPRDLVRFTIPILVAGAAAIAILYAVYGTPIPHSITAKSAMQGPDPAADRAARLAMIVRQAFLPRTAYAPILGFAVVGVVRAWRAGGAARTLSIFALAISASYIAARPHTWGWYYYVPLAGLVLWTALGIEAAFEFSVRRAGSALRHAVESFAPQLASVGLAGLSFFAASRLESPIEARVYAPLWAWAERTSAAEPGARILASDIGAIGHRWKGIVLDSEGLTWPEALLHKFPATIIDATAPEYLLVVAERPRLRHLEARPDILARYEAIERFNATGKTALDPTPEDVPIEWSQDYLVYRLRR